VDEISEGFENGRYRGVTVGELKSWLDKYDDDIELAVNFTTNRYKRRFRTLRSLRRCYVLNEGYEEICVDADMYERLVRDGHPIGDRSVVRTILRFG